MRLAWRHILLTLPPLLMLGSALSYAQELPPMPTAPETVGEPVVAAPVQPSPQPPAPTALPVTSPAPTPPPSQATAPSTAPVPVVPQNAQIPTEAPMAVPPSSPPMASAPQNNPTRPFLLNSENLPVLDGDEDHPFALSMGEGSLSLLFSPLQVTATRNALLQFESRKAIASAKGEVVVVETPQLQEVRVEEPPLYPVFYLSSISYRAPGDWSIWVSGHKITSSKNTTTLAVKAVSADSVTLAWKPTYAEAFSKRMEEHLFAPIDKVRGRISKFAQPTYDQTTGLVTFTLHANQSFVPAYFHAFEGFVESAALEPLITQVANTNTADPLTPQRPALPASQRIIDPALNAIKSRL